MKETFIIKSVWKSVFDDLSDKQAGVLIKAVFEYIATGEKPAELQDLEVRMAFKFMALDLDAFKEKYEDKCAINRDNGMKGAVFGKLGGRPRKSEKTPKNPERGYENPENPERPLTDTDTDNDYKESNTSNEVSLKKAGDNSSPESPALEISDNRTSALNDEKTSAQNTPPPTPSPEADGQGVPPGADPQSGIAAHIAEQFGKFWDMYGKKTSPKDKCFQKWKKLSAADREAIFRTLPQYVANTPDKRYRKDPATYLNQRVWEFDELPDCRQNGFSKPPEPPKSRIQEAFDTLQRAKQMLRNEQYANNTD